MSMDPGLLRQLLLGAIPPGVAGVLIFAALWWGRGGSAVGGTPARSSVWRSVLMPLLLAAVYGVMHPVLFGLEWPPVSSMDWLLIGVAAAGVVAPVVGGLAGGNLRARAGGWLLQVLAIVLVAWLVAGNLRGSWNLRDGAVQIGAFVLITAAALLSCGFIAVRRSGLVPPLMLLLLSIGASQVLALGFHSLKLSQSAGVWAALIGGAALLAFLRRGARLGQGAVLLLAVAVMAALFQGVLFTYTPRGWLYMALMAAGPAVGAATLWGVDRTRWRGRALGSIAALVLAALPIAAAFALILSAESGADDYEY